MAKKKPVKKVKKKPAKKRASKYEPKLQVKGSFIDLINVAVGKKGKGSMTAWVVKSFWQRKRFGSLVFVLPLYC
jgi:hypothetical protein